MFGASERMVLPESQSIRGWLLQQSPQMFLGKPPTSPLVVTSAGKSTHLPSPSTCAADSSHAPPVDRVAAHSDGEWNSVVRHRSPEAFADDDNAEASADSSVSPPRMSHFAATFGDRTRLSPSPTDVAPREALSVSPTPHRLEVALSHTLVAESLSTSNAVNGARAGFFGSAPRTVLFKDERSHSQRLVDFMHDCQRVRHSIQASQQNEFVHLLLLCQRDERAILRDRDLRLVAHECRSDSAFSCSRATMTDPFVGFAVEDYLSLEICRTCALESLERRLLESEQERHRLRDVEYPSFRRVAKFTVSRFETLFLKKERIAREQSRRADVLFPSPGPSESLPPRPPSPRQQLLEAQLGQLLSELEHSVIPCLREVGQHETGLELERPSSGNTGGNAASEESIRALVEVVSLLHHELCAVGDALISRSAKHRNGPNHALPPQSKPPSGLQPHTSNSEERRLASSTNHSSSRTCSELSNLVASLLEQNQILVEALAEAEAAGFPIRPEVLEKLKLGAFVA